LLHSCRGSRGIIYFVFSSEYILYSHHDEKANILWEAYKEILGTREFTHVYFDLSALVNRVDNLADLALLFPRKLMK
jgi:hypothetical protein